VDGDVYTYKDLETLSKMAENIAGTPEENNGYEIIVYCGVGGYASSWWYLLTQVLGYENVKFYDGSAQEWVREYDMKPFEWQD
ncbi:MAG: rhodanese-like domain-containing protein, partial [Desulfobacteraceae bacterium]